MSNPLLSNTILPTFSQITAEHIQPAVDEVLKSNRQAIEDLLLLKQFSFETLVLPLEKLQDNLNKVWSVIAHLNNVKDTPEFRKAYDAALPKVTAYFTELGQNEALYLAYQAIADSPEFQSLNYAQKKLVNDAIMDFKLAGVALSKERKAEFMALRKELSELESKFGHNVLDATQAWYSQETTEDSIRGIPEHAVKTAQEKARSKGLSGYVFTMDYPSYHDVITYAENRALREKIYSAYYTKASGASEEGSNAGQWNNDAIIEEILKKRTELAKLLDFKNYAEYSLAKKMAKKTDEVMKFLEDLSTHTKPYGEEEMAELKEFARDSYQIEEIKPWDLAYLSEKQRQARYELSLEELRAYFPIDSVLEGLFAIASKLFSIQIQENKDFERWHPSVRLFNVLESSGEIQGQFFLDLYQRDNKRSGAWCGTCRDRIQWPNGELQLPVAYVVTNFANSVDSKPALLQHNDVITLFHEFGHCLNHVLTKIDYASISGFNGVSWDAVECPSQLMENWCFEEEALKLYSKNYETGESLPSSHIQKLKASKNYQSALQMLRQLEFALFDFKIHLDPSIKTRQSVQNVLDSIRNQISVVPQFAKNRFQNSFTHIFAGSYAAGYYSYKWAEVLSSDVFESFEEEGIFNSKTGSRFKKAVLEQGGAKEAMELFVEFKGRRPDSKAMLRHSGLL